MFVHGYGQIAEIKLEKIELCNTLVLSPNIYDSCPEVEICPSAASMLPEEIWQIVEGFVEVPKNL